MILHGHLATGAPWVQLVSCVSDVGSQDRV